MTPAYWLATVWLCSAIAATLGYIVGRAFQREERTSMQLEAISLRGLLDRESQRLRTAQNNLAEAHAQLRAWALIKLAAPEKNHEQQPASQ